MFPQNLSIGRLRSIGRDLFFRGALLCALIGLAIAFGVDDQKEKRDTTSRYEGRKADERVADYTWWLNVFTAFLGAFAATQILFLKRTDETARISALAAEKAANAAIKSAEIAEQALIAGSRAFISVTFNVVPVLDPETQEIFAWSFTPIWDNKGETPTRDMQNHFNISLFDDPLPDDWDFPDQWGNHIQIPIPIGAAPKSFVWGPTLTVPVASMDEVVAGTKYLFVWGWAKYRDVFPNTPLHVTRFANQIVVGGNPRSRDRISFSYPLIQKYNCCDEECDYQGYPAAWIPRDTVL